MLDTTTAAAGLAGRERGLRFMRLAYFFFFAGIGVVATFLNLHFYNIGLGAVRVGLISTVVPLVQFLSGPIWGYLSDRFGLLRRLLMLSVAGSGLAVLALSRTDSFGGILALMAVFGLFLGPINPLLDAQTLALLGENQSGYGRQRIFGSIGFILTTLLLGRLINRLGEHWIFYSFGLLMAALLLVTFFMPDQRAGLKAGARFDLRVFRRTDWLVFFAAVLLVGMALNGLNNFLSLHVQALGGTPVQVGLAYSLGAISELPVMLFGGRLLRRWGPLRMLQTSFVFYALRMALYAIAGLPWLAVGIGLMHSVSFGFYWIASVSYADQIAEPSLRATAQSARISTLYLANVVSGLLAGALFDRFGGRGMFLALAGFAAAAAVLMFLARRARPGSDLRV